MSTDGYVWSQLTGPSGVYWWRCGTSHTQWTPNRGTPPGQGGIEILALYDCGRPCDHAVCVPAAEVVRVLCRDSVLDRVPDIPVVPQNGDSTVQSLNKVVDAGCARQMLVVQTVLLLRSPTRSSTSMFARSEQEVPQIQSSTELNDDLEWFGCFFGAFSAIFRTPPRGVESRGARIFRASTVKSSPSSRVPWSGGVARCLTPR